MTACPMQHMNQNKMMGQCFLSICIISLKSVFRINPSAGAVQGEFSQRKSGGGGVNEGACMDADNREQPVLEKNTT